MKVLFLLSYMLLSVIDFEMQNNSNEQISIVRFFENVHHKLWERLRDGVWTIEIFINSRSKYITR
jgi:hypothetical protein